MNELPHTIRQKYNLLKNHGVNCFMNESETELAAEDYWVNDKGQEGKNLVDMTEFSGQAVVDWLGY